MKTRLFPLLVNKIVTNGDFLVIASYTTSFYYSV
jgi:hypothetical protein